MKIPKPKTTLPDHFAFELCTGTIPKKNWRETDTTLRTFPLIVKRFPVSLNRLSSVEVHQLQFF